MRALAQSAPPDSVATNKYRGAHRLLVIYGPGAPARIDIAARHHGAGGRVASFDLGYWDRESSLRLAIDAMHPTPEQMDATPDRGRPTPKLREEGDPNGPILLIGMGDKSLVAYGYARGGWEHRKLVQLQRRFPGRQINWRPKGAIARPMPGTSLCHGMPIEQAISGCSLVVVRHSNVAIDAAIAGVPFEAEDGAAMWLAQRPFTRENRQSFLGRVAWWQWHPHEAESAWTFIRERT